MIKTIHIEDKHYINLPQEEMDRIRTTYNGYQDRFGVLLHPISIERVHEKQVIVLEKGTLVEVHSSTLDGYSVLIKSVFNEKIEFFRLVDKNFASIKHKMAKEIGKDIHDVEFTDQDIELYSKQRCIDYIEEHIGFAEELNNACEPLIHHKEIINTRNDELEVTITFGMGIFALFGFCLMLYCDHIACIVLGIFAILALIFQLISLVYKAKKIQWHKKHLPTDWAKIDSDIAKIITAIEGQNAPREIIEQPKLLTGVTNLLPVDPIPTT